MPTVPKHFRIAEHFGIQASDVRYTHGKGWFIHGHFVAMTIKELEASIFWALGPAAIGLKIPLPEAK